MIPPLAARRPLLPQLALLLAMLLSSGAAPSGAVAAGIVAPIEPNPPAASTPAASRVRAGRAPAAAGSEGGATESRAATAAPGTAGTPASSTPGYSIEPTPGWVVPATDGAGAAAAPGTALHYRLIDRQVRLTGPKEERYQRIVRVVDASAGLAAASQIAIEFDPSYATVALHQVDVVRDGRRSTRLDRKRIQLLQRETQLERRMVDGRMTLSLVLDDVRIGDEVDFAYTLRGANPVFAGRHVDLDWQINEQGPVLLESHRLLAPAGRQIQVRAGGGDGEPPQVRSDGTVRETLSQRRNLMVFRADPAASPEVLTRNPWMASEFADWAAVATWGATLFVDPAGPTPALDALAASIRNQQPTPAGRLRAALDFVQKQVRYFGTEIGVNTHRPAAPEAVLQQRFGDCKDKVGLLLALLHRLDIAGEPVLVSTQLRRHVGDLLPTPLAFNHVVARVVQDGQTYWLDATRGQQTGPLEARQALGFGLGLPLGDGRAADRGGLPASAAGLVEMPSAIGSRRVYVDDQFSLGEFGSPPTLDSRITYRGDHAEGLREALALRGRAAIEAEIGRNYGQLYPKIRPLQPMVVEESADDNAVSLVQRYTVPEFWRFPEQRLLIGSAPGWGIAAALRVPGNEARRDAFVVPAPGVYIHHIGMHYPADVFAKPSTQNNTDDDPRVALDSQAEIGRRSVDLLLTASLRTEEVPAADWPAYTDRLRKLMPRLGLGIPLPPVPLDKGEALAAEIKRMEDDVRSGKVRPPTRIQAEAPMKLASIDAEIAGGRLEPYLLAQALMQRAIQLDHLGRLDAAGADLERALALAPDDRNILATAAANALLRNRSADVASLTDRILRQNSRDVDALQIRAWGRFVASDYGGTAEALKPLLKESNAWQRGYPLVLWSLLQLRTGVPPAAAPDTGGVPREGELPTDWPRPLLDWARGKLDADAVLAAARAGKVPAERLCEAYYYFGERLAAEGDLRRAGDAWRKSTEQGVREFTEDGLARIRLAQLGGN